MPSDQDGMGTSVVSTPSRQAGAHAQETADRLRQRTLLAVLASLAIMALAIFVLGHGPLLIAIEAVALAVMLLVPRRLEPVADR
jgi:hypothetical protein